MSFYSVFFWWLMGAVSGLALSLFFTIWWWGKAVSRGIIAIKDSNGNWVGLDFPDSARNRPTSAVAMQSESDKSASTEIEEVIAVLKDTKRIGAEKDEPEGVRYIQISDALANRLIEKLEEYLENRWSDGIDAMGEDA